MISSFTSTCPARTRSPCTGECSRRCAAASSGRGSSSTSRRSCPTELRKKNEALESTLERLRTSQDQIISQQKLAELGDLSAGAAHEIRNPLQFVKNFAESSVVLVEDLEQLVAKPDGLARADVQAELSELVERSQGQHGSHHPSRRAGEPHRDGHAGTQARRLAGASASWTSITCWSSRRCVRTRRRSPSTADSI